MKKGRKRDREKQRKNTSMQEIQTERQKTIKKGRKGESGETRP